MEAVSFTTMTPEEREKRIFSAVNANNLRHVEALLAAGVDVNKRYIGQYMEPRWRSSTNFYYNYNGETLLFMACDNGNIDIIERLLSAGADVNISNNSRQTPLFAALTMDKINNIDEKNNIAIVDLLLKNGAEINTSNTLVYYSPLYKAAINNQVDIFNLLISKGADINYIYKEHETILFSLIKYSSYWEPIKRVLDAGANIHEVNNDGETALICAIKRDFPIVVSHLIALDVDINKPDKLGQTPLIVASEARNMGALEILLSNSKVDIEARDIYGLTALNTMARLAYFSDVIKRLLEAKAKIETRDDQGRTPLFWAVWSGGWGGWQSVEVLLNAGADFNARDKTNKSVEDIPHERVGNYGTIIKLIENAKIKRRYRNTFQASKMFNGVNKAVAGASASAGAAATHPSHNSISKLPNHLRAHIASYVSGKTGTIPQQVAALRGNALAAGLIPAAGAAAVAGAGAPVGGAGAAVGGARLRGSRKRSKSVRNKRRKTRRRV